MPARHPSADARSAAAREQVAPDRAADAGAGPPSGLAGHRGDGAEEGADLILLGWNGRADADAVLGTTIDEAVRNAPCDIAVAKGVSVQAAERILVPIRGGPHAALAFKLATGLADRVDGIVTALRIERPAAGEPDEGTIASRERDREEFEAVMATAPRRDRIREVVVEASSVVEAILRQAETHQVVVMGAAASAQDPSQIFGPIAEEIAQAAGQGAGGRQDEAAGHGHPRGVGAAVRPRRLRRRARPTSLRSWTSGSPRTPTTAASSRTSTQLVRLKRAAGGDDQPGAAGPERSRDDRRRSSNASSKS